MFNSQAQFLYIFCGKSKFHKKTEDGNNKYIKTYSEQLGLGFLNEKKCYLFVCLFMEILRGHPESI